MEIIETKETARAIWFAAKARCRQETRYSINGLYIDKKHIVGTDGKRLHCVKIETNLPEGVYRVIKANKTRAEIVLDTNPGQAFPKKWAAVIPQHTEQFEGWTSISQVMASLGSKGIMVNPDYLKDAAIDEMELCRYGKPSSSILLCSRDTTYIAVLMPISGGEIKWKTVKTPITA